MRRSAPPPTAARGCPPRLQGDVLEVSAGTGRNLPYYPLARMRSLTLTDTSRHMLVNAADKFAELTQGQAAPLPVRFELADAQQLVERPGGSGSESSSESSSERSSSVSSSTAGALGAPATPRQQGEAAPLRPALKQQQRFPPRSFDVVVDTFGLCSQQDPVTALKVGWGGAGKTCAVPAAAECAAALLPPSSPAPLAWPPAQEMARVCKPGGRILLLQHGRGTWGFINRILDNSAGAGRSGAGRTLPQRCCCNPPAGLCVAPPRRPADDHWRKWGCYWNKNISQIVRQAGLRVESESRWHFGTTYLIVARPPDDSST